LLATNRCDVTLKTVEGATVLHYFVRKEPQKGRVWGQDSYFVLIKKIVGTNTRCTRTHDTHTHMTHTHTHHIHTRVLWVND
jgi:hypothetical protein